jgi:sn-glycerol 3-phosphate transport system substrate-binding protein
MMMSTAARKGSMCRAVAGGIWSFCQHRPRRQSSAASRRGPDCKRRRGAVRESVTRRRLFSPRRYWPDVAGAPQNTIIGGATLWVLRNRPPEEYKGVAKFFGFLSKPEVQSAWHQNTGYLPITRAAFELTRAQGFYDRNPGTAISIEQITMKPPTENSRGLRLGSFVLIRDAIDDELEQAFSGKKSAQAALDSAVERGNRLLRQFERANPDR